MQSLNYPHFNTETFGNNNTFFIYETNQNSSLPPHSNEQCRTEIQSSAVTLLAHGYLWLSDTSPVERQPLAGQVAHLL